MCFTSSSLRFANFLFFLLLETSSTNRGFNLLLIFSTISSSWYGHSWWKRSKSLKIHSFVFDDKLSRSQGDVWYTAVKCADLWSRTKQRMVKKNKLLNTSSSMSYALLGQTCINHSKTAPVTEHEVFNKGLFPLLVYLISFRCLRLIIFLINVSGDFKTKCYSLHRCGCKR